MAESIARRRMVLATLDLVRVNDRVLNAAGVLPPADLRSLDAIHLATAQQLGADLGQIVTYDDRMLNAANRLGFKVYFCSPYCAPMAAILVSQIRT